jgi:hypothetical protein
MDPSPQHLLNSRRILWIALLISRQVRIGGNESFGGNLPHSLTLIFTQPGRCISACAFTPNTTQKEIVIKRKIKSQETTILNQTSKD